MTGVKGRMEPGAHLVPIARPEWVSTKGTRVLPIAEPASHDVSMSWRHWPTMM